MSRNPQTEAAKEAAQNRESTMGNAAQASAARLIRELRNHYAQIINTEVETTADIKNAQQYLCAYLTNLIIPNKSFVKDPTLKRHPAIVATIRVIDYIVENYSDPDKTNVLSQMLSIAKTHPGFEKWSDSDNQWSQNKIYNAESNTMDVVKTSPAETLNLVCAALFDPMHLVAGTSIDHDRTARIHSLFTYLKNLFKEEKEGKYTICAAGRQHGILFLLNHVFCERPHQTPMILIEDQHTFTLNALSDFIKTQLDASPDKSSEVVSDWLLYQLDMVEREVAPVITFLRWRFPSEQKDNLDIKWKAALDDYLKKQYAAFGLDPATCQSNTLAGNISYIQPPTLNPLVSELIEARPLSATGFLQSLTEQRNHALAVFKARFKSNEPLSSDEISSLYITETLFQKLYTNRYYALLIGANDPPYQASLSNAVAELRNFYQTNERSTQFEAVQTEYQKQLNILNEKGHFYLIENFFVNGKTIEQNLATIYEEIAKLSEHANNPFLITDDAIERWFAENTSTELPGAIDVSPFEINRILLHVLLTKDIPDQRSAKISQAVEFILNWIVEPEQPTDTGSKKALKKAYLSHLKFYWMDFIIHLSPDAIRRICALPNMPRKIIDSLGIYVQDKTKKLADFINSNNPQKICALLESISAKKEDFIQAIDNSRSHGEFIDLLSQITFDKCELVFELLKNRLFKVILSINELLELTKLHDEALNELKQEGLTPYHFLKWDYYTALQESHKKALIYLVKTKHWAPEKAIAELSKLHDHQALRISTGFSRDDVRGLSEYKLQALEELHHDGLTGDILRSCNETRYWRFEEAHKKALIYCIREKHLAPIDAITEIHELGVDQARAIMAGLSRKEIEHLNKCHLETLLELRDEGLTGDHLRSWQRSSSADFDEPHKKALIFLIKIDKMTVQDALQAISGPRNEPLLSLLASPINKKIKNIIKNDDAIITLFQDLEINLDQFLTLDHDDMELMFKHRLKVKTIVSQNSGKKFQINEIISLLKKKINDDDSEKILESALVEFFSRKKDFHWSPNQEIPLVHHSQFFTAAPPDFIDSLILKIKLTAKEAISLTKQERRNLTTPRIYDLVITNALTISSAKILTEEQRVRLENGEALQQVITRR